MKHLAEVLEFFEDFYAGFLQILLQLYILFLDFAEQKSLGVGFCKLKYLKTYLMFSMFSEWTTYWFFFMCSFNDGSD